MLSQSVIDNLLVQRKTFDIDILEHERKEQEFLLETVRKLAKLTRHFKFKFFHRSQRKICGKLKSCQI
jgi:hypothetical protein